MVDDLRIIKPHDLEDCWKLHNNNLNNNNNDTPNHNKENKPEIITDLSKTEEHKHEHDDVNIIPWRAQLRKTNSKLNLLD